MSSLCAICKGDEGPFQKVTQKGLRSLLEICQKKNEFEILDFLETSKDSNTDIIVHNCCRKSFIDKRKLLTKEKKMETRKSSEMFDMKLNCLFCGKQCSTDVKHRSRKTWVQVSTIDLKDAILKECSSRIKFDPNDEWGIRVKGKVQGCIDLVAGNARYHPMCRLLFKSNRTLKKATKTSYIKGRQFSRRHVNIFHSACSWLENVTTVHSLKEFRTKVQELLIEGTAYTSKYLKQLLICHYGSHFNLHMKMVSQL